MKRYLLDSSFVIDLSTEMAEGTAGPAVEDFDEYAAQLAAEVGASLETMRPNAQPIGPYDVLLAGHALAMGAVLVTHNTGEFSRVPGLSVEDWQESFTSSRTLPLN